MLILNLFLFPGRQRLAFFSKPLASHRNTQGMSFGIHAIHINIQWTHRSFITLKETLTELGGVVLVQVTGVSPRRFMSGVGPLGFVFFLTKFPSVLQLKKSCFHSLFTFVFTHNVVMFEYYNCPFKIRERITVWVQLHPFTTLTKCRQTSGCLKSDDTSREHLSIDSWWVFFIMLHFIVYQTIL